MDPKLLEIPSNRKFGFFFALIFLLFALIALSKQLTEFFIIFFSLAGVFFLCALMLPNILYPLNKLWLNLGLGLAKIINPLVLGIIFFGLFVPIGMITKLFRRDELTLNFQMKESYWKKRNTQSSQLSSFKNPF